MMSAAKGGESAITATLSPCPGGDWPVGTRAEYSHRSESARGFLDDPVPRRLDPITAWAAASPADRPGSRCALLDTDLAASLSGGHPHRASQANSSMFWPVDSAA